MPDVPHRLDWHPIRHVHVCHQSVLERADAGVRDVPHRLVQPGRRRDINIVHVLRSQRVLERYRLPDVPHRLVQPGRRRDVNIVHVLRSQRVLERYRLPATCPTGSFSPGGAATSTSCTSCEANEFWNEQAQACETCPTNYFSEGGAATTTTCMTCPAGQYRNSDAGCGACPTGSTSPGGSVTSCDTCLSHYYKSGSMCVACPANSVGAGGSATSCTCNDNYHAHWSGSAWSCLACAAPVRQVRISGATVHRVERHLRRSSAPSSEFRWGNLWVDIRRSGEGDQVKVPCL